ncbi:hypothetical protein RG959_05575 [Domibacillus sp. 8LH]|uniref:hypothetical protein n=1 Tax=Domibacillus sp. 8LH TaxID=3073900 RepID=UPI003174F969
MIEALINKKLGNGRQRKLIKGEGRKVTDPKTISLGCLYCRMREVKQLGLSIQEIHRFLQAAQQQETKES